MKLKLFLTLPAIAMATNVSAQSEDLSYLQIGIPGITDFTVIADQSLYLNGTHNHQGMYVNGNLVVDKISNVEFGTDYLEDSRSNSLYVGGTFSSTEASTTNPITEAMKGAFYVNSFSTGLSLTGGTQLASDPFSGFDVFGEFKALSASLGALTDTNTVSIPSNFDPNKNEIKVNSVGLNVVNLASGDSGPNTTTLKSILDSKTGPLDFLSDSPGGKLLVNFSVPVGTSSFEFNSKTHFNDPVGFEDVIWNFTFADESLYDGTIVFGGPERFNGSILAPEATIQWERQELWGQAVSKVFNWNSDSKQSHLASPFNVSAVPETSTLALLALTAFATVLGFRSKRHSSGAD